MKYDLFLLAVNTFHGLIDLQKRAEVVFQNQQKGKKNKYIVKITLKKGYIVDQHTMSQ